MKLAEKFKRPIVCFIDTAGANPGQGAEERGQGQALAENIMEMTALKNAYHFYIYWRRRKWWSYSALAVADRSLDA